MKINRMPSRYSVNAELCRLLGGVCNSNEVDVLLHDDGYSTRGDMEKAWDNLLPRLPKDLRDALLAVVDGRAGRGFRPRKVVRSGPVTVLLYDDGTKSIVRLEDGAKDIPLVGVLNAALRKRLGNRGKTDRLWKAVKGLAKVNPLVTPKELRAFAAACLDVADVLDGKCE